MSDVIQRETDRVRVYWHNNKIYFLPGSLFCFQDDIAVEVERAVADKEADKEGLRNEIAQLQVHDVHHDALICGKPCSECRDYASTCALLSVDMTLVVLLFLCADS
jgi:hypothetical protein